MTGALGLVSGCSGSTSTDPKTVALTEVAAPATDETTTLTPTTVVATTLAPTTTVAPQEFPRADGLGSFEIDAAMD